MALAVRPRYRVEPEQALSAVRRSTKRFVCDHKIPAVERRPMIEGRFMLAELEHAPKIGVRGDVFSP